MLYKEITKQLCIGEHMVRTHFVNIFRKLGVSSGTQAVLPALRNGWLTLDNPNSLCQRDNETISFSDFPLLITVVETI